MKILLFLSLILFFILPFNAEARSLSELKSIKLVSYEEINQKCFQPEGYDPINGCYLYTPIREIYIRDDLPLERFKFIFWHEIGHFFMEGMTDEQLREIFHPTPQAASNIIISEIAADKFALWMMGGRIPENQKNFFIKLLTE